MNIFKSRSFFSHLLLSIIVFSFVIFGFLTTQDKMQKSKFVYAGGNHNLRGFAWGGDSSGGETGGIGWVSFNCLSDLSCSSNMDYGVNLNPTSNNYRTLTGYAWSENYGWILFGNLSGFPSGDGTSAENARLNVSTNQFEGWAKAVAVDGAGWDGWISLKGSNYGVSLDSNTDELSGYAWGGPDGIGWISFRGVNFGVNLETPILATCTASPSTGVSGEGTTWSVTSTGGITGTLSYLWSRDDDSTANGIVSGTSATALTPSVTGPQDSQLIAKISISNGTQFAQGSCRFTINNNIPCTGPGNTSIPFGECKIYYKSSKAPSGGSCESQKRCCEAGGALSSTPPIPPAPEFTFPSCYPGYIEF